MSTSSTARRRAWRAGLVVPLGAFISVHSHAGATATTEPDGIVDAAVAGFDAYLAELDLPDAGGDYDEAESCPLLTPEELNVVVAALGYDESFDQRTAEIGVEAIESSEAEFEYPALVCTAAVPSEVRSTPIVRAGALRLPDDVTFADVIAEYENTEITGPTPGALGGQVTTICESDGSCSAIWESPGLAIFLNVDETALEELGHADLDTGLEALLEPTLRNLAELADGVAPTTT